MRNFDGRGTSMLCMIVFSGCFVDRGETAGYSVVSTVNPSVRTLRCDVAGMGRDVEEWLSGALSMEQTQKLAKVICSKILNLPLNTLVVDHLKVATHPTHPTHPTSFPPERDRADPNSIPPNILCSRL